MLPCLEAFIYLFLPSQGKFKLLSVVSEEVLYNPTTPVLTPACHEQPPPMPMCLFLSSLLPSLKDQAYPFWRLHSCPRESRVPPPS